ncbi:MAG: TIGR04255 family protein [Acidobacteria bacterium]|nr:TIGR04255 family protein [Acidobacteriota bacterium]
MAIQTRETENSSEMKSELPNYENPPVNEVVCGIQFKSLDNLRIPHVGVFWEKVKSEYPNCQEVAPLIPVIERFGDQEGLELPAPNEVPLPRVWFLNSTDTGIIQVQRDRFLHNWKKANATDVYPQYPIVIDLFKRHLSTFDSFLDEHGLGSIEPKQYEMTYVNQILQGEGWDELSDLSKVFRDYSWHTEERFLPVIEHVNLRKTFALPEGKGRMHVAIRDGMRRDDGRPVILFEFTVRGFPGDAARERMWAWFDLAREWIVRGFADLTTDEVQKNLWRRTR